MRRARNGDIVKVHYIAKLENGMVIDTSKGRQPLEFMIGGERVVRGVEKGVIGMEIGETRTIKILPGEAFGPRREELVVEIKNSDLPRTITPFLGQRLSIRDPDGCYVYGIVADMKENTVTLDANHPLAGKALILDIELIRID